MDVSKIYSNYLKSSMVYGQTKPRETEVLKEEPILNKETIEDIISISEEGKAILEERDKLIKRREDYLFLLEELEKLNETLDGMEESYSEKLKCIIIAMRIMKGDIVPAKDKRFLAEKEPQMFANAIMLRRLSEEPKKHKSLLRDKNEDSTAKGAELDKDGGQKIEAIGGGESPSTGDAEIDIETETGD